MRGAKRRGVRRAHEDETSGRKLRNGAEAKGLVEWFVSMAQLWLSRPECLKSDL